MDGTTGEREIVLLSLSLSLSLSLLSWEGRAERRAIGAN